MTHCKTRKKYGQCVQEWANLPNYVVAKITALPQYFSTGLPTKQK